MLLEGIKQAKAQDSASPRSEVSISQAPFSAAERASGTPCSWNQEQMYLVHQQLPNKCTYSEPFGVTLKGKLELDALQRAFVLLVHRHEALRSGFVMSRGDLCQYVMPMDEARPQFQVLHLPDMSHSHVQAAFHEQAMRPFDLAKPPLLRAVLAQLAKQLQVTLLEIVLSAVQALLAYWSGQEEVVVGVPSHGRTQPGLMSAVGYFVNVMPLRTDVGSCRSFAQLVTSVSQHMRQAKAHALIPLGKVITRLKLPRDNSRNSVFQVTVAPEVGMPKNLDFAGLTALELDTDQLVDEPKMDLSFTAPSGKVANPFKGGVKYALDVINKSTVESMVDMLQELLRALPIHEDTTIQQLLSEAARGPSAVTKNFSPPCQQLPPNMCLHHMFEEQAARRPEAPCLLFKDDLLSYGLVDCLANKVAAQLLAHGLVPEEVVGVLLPRGFELYIALLSVLKAGGACLMLDTEQPIHRHMGLLKQLSSSLVLSSSQHLEGWPSEGPIQAIQLDGLLSDSELKLEVAESAPQQSGRRSGSRTASRLAFVLFTSGSTGQPKGTELLHAGLVNITLHSRDAYGIGPADVLLQSTSTSFDVSLLEIFSALSLGGQLAILPPGAQLEPQTVMHTMAKHAVTMACAVPSVLAAWHGGGLSHTTTPRLAVLMIGGEPFPTELLRTTCAALPDTLVLNCYGPAEASINVTNQGFSASKKQQRQAGFGALSVLPPPAGHSVPIGCPVTNTQIHILDQHQRPVPVRVAGEICISGICLAKGYAGRSDLTEASFLLASPGSQGPVRIYRSGDLGRWRHDGTIEILGRADRQIKIRGQRMEPGEVEHTVTSMKGVMAAHVMMRKHPATQEAMLVAYVTPASADQLSIQQHCRARLAKHMVPAFVVPLDTFPRLPSGKTDASSLPEPEWSASGKHSEPPQQAIHKHLAGLWELVLQQQGIGINDDFFEIGGSSLLAGQLATAIRQDMHVEISSMLIFQHSTIAAMAHNPAFSKWHRHHASSQAQDQEVHTDVRNLAVPRVSSWNILPLQLLWITLVQGLHFFSLICFFLFVGQFALWWKGRPHHIATIIVPAPFLLATTILWLLFAIVVIKWCLLGRAKAGRYPLWGRAYLRQWSQRHLLQIAQGFILPLLRGTKLLNAYLRLLGAKIGHEVIIDTMDIAGFDLIVIGDNVSVGIGATISATSFQAAQSHEEPGSMSMLPVSIGSGCTIAPGAKVVPGMRVEPDSLLAPPGCCGGLTAQPKATELKATGARPLPWLLSIPALVLVFFLHLAALIPLVVAIYGLYYGATVSGGISNNFGSSQQCLHSALPLRNAVCRKWIRGGIVASAISPWALRASGLLYALLMVASKWCLLGRIAPGKGISARGLWWYLRFDLFQTLQAGPLLGFALALAHSNLLFPLYLRCLGARCGLHSYIAGLHTNAHDLLEIGDGLIIDSFNTAITVSSAAAHPVTVADGASMGNYGWLMPGAVVAPTAVLGNAAFLPPDKHVPPGSTTMGSQLLRPGQDIESGSLKADTDASAVSRSARTPHGKSSTNTAEASDPAREGQLSFWLFSSLNLAGSLVSPLFQNIQIMPFAALMSLSMYTLGLPISLAVFPLAVAISVGCACLFLKLLHLAAGRKFKEEGPYASLETVRWLLLNKAVNVMNIVPLLNGTALMPCLLRFLGAHVGKDLLVANDIPMSYFCVDARHISIGDGVVINHGADVIPHSVDRGQIGHPLMRIDSHVTLGPHAQLLPGCSIQPFATLDAAAITLKGELVGQGAFWSGIPARPTARSQPS
ncbi:hypothetical protein WJX74_003722 [Apatococcus lobatus]|uniref:Carrier domain-containing protein n=1 Tax=Apatococcus lobatus TaxID=904363 RepID=A0AAW1RYX9_9CHLO